MSKEENDAPADLRELVRWAVRTQRNLDFVVGRQAQFSADLQLFLKDQEERWKGADARWAETEKGIRALHAIAEIHEQEIAALAQTQAAAQARTDKQLAETGKQLDETGRRLDETGERVDALVNTMERLISERRNGGAAGPEGAGGLRR